MAEDNTLARPYAEAIFEIAQSEGKLAEWSAALEAAALVASDEALIDEVDNPKLGDAELLRLLQSIFGGIPAAAGGPRRGHGPPARNARRVPLSACLHGRNVRGETSAEPGPAP